MLEPVAMERITAVLLDRDEEAALEALGRLGLVHLVRLAAGPDTAPRPPLDPPLGGSPWAALLDRVEGLLGAFGIASRASAPRAGEPQELERIVHAAEQRARDLAARREALARRREELSRDSARLARWQGLEVPARRVGAGAWAVLRLGSVPASALEGLGPRLAPGGLALALPAPSGARRAIVVLGLARDAAALDAALRASGFEEEAPPPGEGTLEDVAAARSREAACLDEGSAHLDAEARALAGELAGVLAGIEARARLERRLAEARGCLPRTGTALLLEGWTPAADGAAVERCVRDATHGRCVLEHARPRREEEDEVPVLIRASRLLRPFEKLVAGFGLPRYRELSPTPFLAASFLVMFGVMFGDVGHGAILAVAGACGLAAGRWRDPSLLLVLCGLSSAAVGAIYGSCFGLERFRELALWRDPLEGDPLGFLAMGIGVGVATISLGVLLHVFDRLRHGDALAALLDRFGLAGLGFYWAGLALVAGGTRGTPAPRAAGGLLLLCVTGWVIGGLVEDARGRRWGAAAPGAGLVAGLVEAFEAMLAYLANTISFVRLAAYGMAHAALILAVLMTARAAGRPGGLAAGVVLVLGNALAIALEGVVAGVQALRLEYYEFFGKFFSGAGRRFEPFRLEPMGGAP